MIQAEAASRLGLIQALAAIGEIMEAEDPYIAPASQPASPPSGIATRPIARHVLSTVAMALCTAAGTFLIYKIGSISGQDAICYAGLISGQLIFFPAGRKLGALMLAPAIVAGVITSLPAFAFVVWARTAGDDQVVFLAQLLPAYGSLLGCSLGVISGMAANNSFKPKPLRGSAYSGVRLHVNTPIHPPSFAETAEFVRRFAGHRRRVTVAADTRLEADLGITGDDGADLLEDAARQFNAALAGPDGYRSTFGLGPNEYLFHAESFDLTGIGKLIDWVLGRTPPVIRDLTVGQLHEAICRTQAASGAA